MPGSDGGQGLQSRGLGVASSPPKKKKLEGVEPPPPDIERTFKKIDNILVTLACYYVQVLSIVYGELVPLKFI